MRENRVSGLVIHCMMAGSLFFLDYIGYIPMAVLFGLFLYMGLASLNGNQFFDRLMLWVTDPKLYPNTHYIRLVPPKWIHRFTTVQLASFIVLWLLKASKLGILFPLMIAALVPINMLLARYIPAPYMEALSAEEAHDDEEKHTLD